MPTHQYKAVARGLRGKLRYDARLDPVMHILVSGWIDTRLQYLQYKNSYHVWSSDLPSGITNTYSTISLYRHKDQIQYKDYFQYTNLYDEDKTMFWLLCLHHGDALTCDIFVSKLVSGQLTHNSQWVPCLLVWQVFSAYMDYHHKWPLYSGSILTD